MSGFAAEFDMAIGQRFQDWTYKKPLTDAPQHSPSGSSTAEFEDERIRVRSNVYRGKRFVSKEQRAYKVDQYMSSEEALSPADLDESEGDLSETELESEFRAGITSVAIALIVVAAGKASLINVRAPTLPSASKDSKSRLGLNFRSKKAPAIRDRNPKRPTLHTVRSATTSADQPSPRSATDPSIKAILDDYSPKTERTATLARSRTTHTPITYSPSSTQTTPYYSHPVAIASTPAFLAQDPYNNAQERSQRPTANHSRLRNLSLKIGRISSPNNQTPKPESYKPTMQTQPELASPAAPTSAKPKPRMIARGANERAPLMTIPPCPYDLDDEDVEIPKRNIKRRSMG